MSAKPGHKPTEIGELPEDWETVNLEKVLQLCDSGTWGIGKGTPDNGVPILRSTNIQEGRLVLDGAELRVVESQKLDRYRLLLGDIIVVRSSGSSDLVGDLAYFDLPEKGVYLFSNYTQRLRTNDRIRPKFLYYYLSSPTARKNLTKLFDTTTGLKNISFTTYRGQMIPLPPKAEQDEIVSVLSTLDSVIVKTEEMIAKTKQLKNGHR